MYRTIIMVQSGEELDVCSTLYDGEENWGTGISDHNGDAVIDYLKQWDDDQAVEDDFDDCEPFLCNNGTDYVYEKDGYTLLYNTTIGGAFLLYREATEQEEDWYFHYK